MKKKTIYGLSPKRVARLLAIGKPGGGALSSAALSKSPAEVLQDILSRELPLDPFAPNSLPAILDWPCREVLTAARRTIGDLLLDSNTDLEILRGLKEYSKTLATRGGPKADQLAAKAIYYAAIASALVFHDRRITQHSYQKLHDTYVKLGKKPWVPSELKDLLRGAGAQCRQEIDDQW